jgi:hypothetical protein
MKIGRGAMIAAVVGIATIVTGEAMRQPPNNSKWQMGRRGATYMIGDGLGSIERRPIPGGAAPPAPQGATLAVRQPGQSDAAATGQGEVDFEGTLVHQEQSRCAARAIQGQLTPYEHAAILREAGQIIYDTPDRRATAADLIRKARRMGMHFTDESPIEMAANIVAVTAPPGSKIQLTAQGAVDTANQARETVRGARQATEKASGRLQLAPQQQAADGVPPSTLPPHGVDGDSNDTGANEWEDLDLDQWSW